MTGISVLKSIHSLLSNNTELTAIVNNKMFPLIALSDTAFPFIVYRKGSVNIEYCKDGLIADNFNVEIIVASKTYNESVEIAEIVRNTIELKKIDNIKSIRLSSATEDFNEDTYIQYLTFDTKISL
ncbi:hypothetical protein EZS27_008297 [termite gut metagenome]|uniref:DUF3168 domain-containing protein n=1 Tax=termite gut metagenome TaxID=433724 RepID=A0A5J4SFE2_9ZZZZ